MAEMATAPKVGKRMPAWIWIAAAGVGLVIGFVFLRKSSAASADTNAGATPSPGTPVDQSGVPAPVSPDFLKALGLQSGPTSGGQPTAGAGTASDSSFVDTSTSSSGPPTPTAPTYFSMPAGTGWTNPTFAAPAPAPTGTAVAPGSGSGSTARYAV